MSEPVVRDARPEDAPVVARLLAMLGYPTTNETAANNLSLLAARATDRVIVAELDGRVVGLAHLHIAKLLHVTGSIGRVMAFVVHADHLRQGIGRRLMSEMEDIARAGGCARIELTSGIHRDGAHAFYQALGYTVQSRRYVKSLGPASP